MRLVMGIQDLYIIPMKDNWFDLHEDWYYNKDDVINCVESSIMIW